METSFLLFHYFKWLREVEYVLRAIEWIADNGKMFLPAYRMDYKSGEWRLVCLSF